MPKAKYWCFTSFNEQFPIFNDKDSNYLTYQLECCGTTGRRHWQGYIECKRTVNSRDVKRILGNDNIHIEPSRSSDAIAYCHKQESRIAGPYSFGTPPNKDRNKPGGRQDLLETYRIASTAESTLQLMDSCPEAFIRYGRNLDRIRCEHMDKPRANMVPTVIIKWGDPNTGKTRFFNDTYPELFWKDNSKWWNGYTGQSVVLFDDFTGSDDISPSTLLRITDRYPFMGETKGGYVNLRAHTIGFTSNIGWKYWYEGTKHADAWQTLKFSFERRITTCERLGG